MASIQPYKNQFRAALCVNRIRDSGIFRTRREAVIWAAARETELRTQAARPVTEKRTLGEMLARYLEEVVPKHRGWYRESYIVKSLQRRLDQSLPLAQAVDTVFADFREERLREVKGSTVLRELKVLSTAFEEARIEWKWVSSNPIKDIRKPPSSPHRKRTITTSEIRVMLGAMKYPRRDTPTALAFLLALRTGMRASEICNLTWDRVSEKHIHLDVTKTNPRDVPLSKKARRIVALIRASSKGADPFKMKEETLSALFVRYRRRAGLDGFTFHDSRHTAATWMARKVDVLTLCKICGWTDPKMAMVYYNPKAADIADQL